MGKSIEFIGIDAVEKRLKEMEDKLQNKKEFREEGALLVVASAQEAFRGNPLGWKANDPDTIRKKGHGDVGIGETRKLSTTIEPIIGADFVGVRYRQFYGRFFEKTRPMAFTQRALKAFSDLNIKIHSWKNTSGK